MTEKRRSCYLPGFASDCVETLEEINIEVKRLLENGGEKFDLVPCLNDRDDHIDLLQNLTKNLNF